MEPLSPERIENLQSALNEQVGDNTWRKLLHIMSRSGVADNRQLLKGTGLNRDKLRRTLEKMAAASSGYPPLFTEYTKKLKRGGERGPGPKVYRLGESGAALCKADGLADAHPCKLEEPRAIQHALGMLDVHLAAAAAGLAVQTDRNLNYNDGEVIRPDNLVTLPHGGKAIFESEQDANSDFLERILRSLANKAAFFVSEAGQAVCAEVRMLLDVPAGKLLKHTLSIWRHALEITRETHGDELPFRLLAMPLPDFLSRPDWSEAADDPRWIDLAEPESPETSAITVQPLAQAALQVPAFSNLERRMVLAALLQYLRESGHLEKQILPDVDFLYVMRLIYLASHDPFAPPLVRSSVPYESLYLLDQYLRMNPSLRQMIERTTQMDARRIHWNQSTAMHRMQVVIDAFLAFHGWRSEGPLLVYAYFPDYKASASRSLSVVVKIADPEILMAGEIAVVPGEREIQILEKSLAWVLKALFANYEHLGLKKAPFW